MDVWRTNTRICPYLALYEKFDTPSLYYVEQTLFLQSGTMIFQIVKDKLLQCKKPPLSLRKGIFRRAKDIGSKP